MSRVYVASSWRNTFQPSTVKLLRLAGHQVYDFRNPPNRTGFAWREADIDKEKLSAEDFRRALYKHPIIAAGYLADYRAMEWADTCVLILPSGRSAHIEAGWFAGARKRLIIYIPVFDEPELMYLCANEIVLSVEELLSALQENGGKAQGE